MRTFLEHHPQILMEAAVVERLRRAPGIELHPELVNAPLIYQEAGRQAMTAIYGGYMAIAQQARLPLMLCTPTWRANRERVTASAVSPRINQDAVAFMQEIATGLDAPGIPVRIGGLMGCRHDCYLPQQALDTAAAERFHQWQADALAEGNADFLMAQTLPSVDEALGMARAMESTGLDYIISFVIGRDGRILDGQELTTAIDRIDNQVRRAPLAYMVNCAYPTFLQADRQPPALFRRLIGCLGNASALDHCELDGAEALQGEPVATWGEAMLSLRDLHGMQVLGGCCGTGPEHLEYLALH